MNARSLAFRLTSYYASLFSVVLILLGGALFVGVRFLLTRNLSETLLRRARLIGSTLAAEIDTAGLEFVGREIDSRFAPESGGWMVRISDGQGKILFLSGRPTDRSFDPEAIPMMGFASRERVVFTKLPGGGDFELCSIPVLTSGKRRLLLEAGATLGPAQSLLNHLLLSFTIGFPLIMGAAVAGGYRLVRMSLESVEKIARSAEAITFQNLNQRLPITKSGDELERLSHALNRMIERLDESFQHTRKFSADASHELRAPLTFIRAELEALAQSPTAPEYFTESIGSILEEVGRLTATIEGLLALARLDAGNACTEWIQVDLGSLVSLVADQMALVADEKQLEIRCHAPHPVFVHGDRARLKQIIVNLLDNAIQFTPKGGGIDLRVWRRNNAAVLEVIDTGIGIPASALPHVFNRFFRVDLARSRNVGGAGIGLSIVKSIVAAHDGEIQITSQEGFGTTVRMELTRAAIPSPVTEILPVPFSSFA